MKKLLITTAIALAFSSNAFADNTDTKTITVEGNIIQELTVEAPEIIMPDVVKPQTGESNSSVSIDCSSNDDETVVTYSSRANPFAAGTSTATTVSESSKNLSTGSAGQGDETGECGIANVNGQPYFAYKVDTSTLGTATDNGVTLKEVKCTSDNDHTLNDSGADTLWCGAKVEVASTAVADDGYVIDTAQLTVTYD